MPASNTRKARTRPKSRTRVEVSSHQRRRIDQKKIAAVVQRVLFGEGWSGEISVGVVDGETMRELNAKFLGHDYVTDALSFTFSRNVRQKNVEGEVVVCANQAVNSARGFKRRWQDELLLYVIHGTLHLIGYNDDTDSKRKKIRAVESKYLQAFGIDVEPVDQATHRRKIQ